MAHGTVKWFNPQKGFGFIEGENANQIFVHISAVEKAGLRGLATGQTVDFDVVGKNPRTAATNIRLRPQVVVPDGYETYDEVIISDTLSGSDTTTKIALFVEERFEALYNAIRNGVIDLRDISPADFELFSLRVLLNEGYEAKIVTACNAADGGVDILAFRGRLNGVTTKFAVQCKRYRGKVSAEPIRSLAGVLDKTQAHQGILMTTGTFTKPAIAEHMKSYWKITLRDHQNLITSLAELDLVKR